MKKKKIILYVRHLISLILYAFVFFSIIPPVPSDTGDDVTTKGATAVATVICIIANIIENYNKEEGYGIIVFSSLIKAGFILLFAFILYIRVHTGMP